MKQSPEQAYAIGYKRGLEEGKTPEHLTEGGLVHYLTRNSNGQWWVSSRKGDVPYSGYPLDYFLEQYLQEEGETDD